MRRPRNKDHLDFQRRPWVASVLILHRDDTDVPRGEHTVDRARVRCRCNPEIVSTHTEARA